jgi:MFS family permease
VNIAIPSIQGSLHATTASVEWLIAGYVLALITGARVGDTYDYKKLFLVGVSAFALASLFCGWHSIITC